MNVIAVDWVYGSTGAYPSAVENVTQLALAISQFISKLLVRHCEFPVQGNGQGAAPNLLYPGAGQVDFLFQIFPFTLFQFRLDHATIFLLPFKF